MSERPAANPYCLLSWREQDLFCRDLPSDWQHAVGKILVTGASGYIGGRLIPELLARGYTVRVMVRAPSLGQEQLWPGAEVAVADALHKEQLTEALKDIDVAYYLIHSMGSRGDFEERDRIAARNFGCAARRAGVRRIIYLGGLGHGMHLSPHLRSRQEVGEILRESGVTVLEFRASIVIGSGSVSFEMIRTLVERLPVMIAPRWIEVEAQPIAVDDLLAYLVAALDTPLPQSRVFEIGGADRATYGDLMREYALQRGLRRAIIRVPVLSPRFSSLGLGLVAPLYARVGRKLMQSLKHATIVSDASALEVFPVHPRGFRQAIAAAIREDNV